MRWECWGIIKGFRPSHSRRQMATVKETQTVMGHDVWKCDDYRERERWGNDGGMVEDERQLQLDSLQKLEAMDF